MSKNILLLGSGMMAQSVVVHLLQRGENRIHIASNIIADAKLIAEKRGLDRCAFSEIDVTSSEQLRPLVSWAQIVISYVPAFLHIHIAKVCLEVGRNLVTASYVSPQMQQLHEAVRERGLLFLNELGLDPGIDHLATMKIVDEVEQKGGKIIQYESWCGGLPAPSCCDNPLGYKFTWSPIGAFRALLNNAVFIQNQEEKAIDSSKLLYYGAEIVLNQALTLQGYPNRDSTSYKAIYGLKDATKVLRGTLRYRGFCEIISGLKELGLFVQTPIQLATNWGQHLENILKIIQGDNLQQKIFNKCVRKIEKYQKLSPQEQKKISVRIAHALKFFRFLSYEQEIHDSKSSCLENLVHLLTKSLSLKPGETDMIAMQHRFLIQFGDKQVRRTSSLIQIGQKQGFSAMSQTVGIPTAIGTQLILDGRIKAKGVLRPVLPEIYIPTIAELEKCGIKLVEVDEDID